MYIAQSKRKENIAEYILYLWQLEDLLRALQFSPEAIFSQLASPGAGDEAGRQELFMWYMELATLLRREGKESAGHLDHTLRLISDMHNLHSQLMKLPAGEQYRILYARLEPELPRLRQLMDNKEISDTELCFRALYAVMLYRIKGDKGRESAIGDVLEVVSPVIAELAGVYRLSETGKINLFGEE